MGLCGALGVARAQDTTRTSRDSLAARLERTEEALRLVQQQLAAQAQAGAQSRSRMSLEFSGRVLVSGFSNTRRVNNVDVPQFVRPDTANGLPQGGGGMAIRQTMLGLAVTAPDIASGAFRGDVEVDFFGGQQASSGGRTFPLLRLRIARARIDWPNGEFMVGQDAPLIAGVNPQSLASIGTPGFATAGNLWLWLPQLRLGLVSDGAIRVGVQGAMLAPNSSDPAASFDTDNDVAERSRRPSFEGRTFLRWGSDDLLGELGIGVHRGWFATKGDSLLESSLTAADVVLPITSWLELRGEWYHGTAARGLGGGAIGQGFAPSGALVRSTGGWGQLNLRLGKRVTLGAGAGEDDPEDADLPATGRLRNNVSELHLHWRPAAALFFGLEFRRLETTYSAGKLLNDHVNLAMGFEF